MQKSLQNCKVQFLSVYFRYMKRPFAITDYVHMFYFCGCCLQLWS